MWCEHHKEYEQSSKIIFIQPLSLSPSISHLKERDPLTIACAKEKIEGQNLTLPLSARKLKNLRAKPDLAFKCKEVRKLKGKTLPCL